MKKNSAFTLIELLVVISIIAVLMAIMMPAMGRAKEQAKAIVCMANGRTLTTAWFEYQNDNGGELVGAHTQLVDGSGDSAFTSCWVARPQKESGKQADYSPKLEDELRGIERGLLFPYTKKTQVYHCPSDRRLKTGETGYRTFSIPGCMNGTWKSGGTYIVKGLKKFTQIKRPSDSIMLMEEVSFSSRGYNVNAWQISKQEDTWVDGVGVMHNGKGGLGFSDGHAEMHKWQDKRTIEFSKDPENVERVQTDNVDWKYVIDRMAN